MRRGLVLLFTLGALACDGESWSADGGAGTGGGDGADHENVLQTRDDFTALAGDGAEVKYLTVVDGREPPSPFGSSECLFQNTATYPYHLQFLRTFPEFETLAPERYADLVLRRSSRTMWGGALKLFAGAPHPVTGRTGVLAYTLYSESSASEMLTVADIVETDARLERCAPFAANLLVFTPDGTAQSLAVADLRDALAAAGVAVVEAAALRPGLSAETYSEGEGYGYLKLVPEGVPPGDVGPRDVLVIDAAPNDLGLVAGLVTRQPQSLASHVNLRLREKSVPSAAVPSVFDNDVLATLANALVHVSARETTVVIEPARLEEAEAFWAARQPPLGAPPANLDVTAPAPLETLSALDAAAFGTKAANLGELHDLLPAANRVEGFAIPFRAYADFMTQRGLDAEVEALLADPLVRTDAAHKRSRLSDLRLRIRGAELLPEFSAALQSAIESAYGAAGRTTRLRFRSSTNVEDLAGVSGAGLYDSRSGCLGDDLDEDDLGPSACLTAEHEALIGAELERRRTELAEHPDRSFLVPIIEDLQADLAEEKSAAIAVRRVWASLWNERAFDDREYYGIDQRRVYMGIAVHPTFVGEQLEAVVVTGLEPDAAEPLYRVVSQAGEIGVVRPVDPGASPEIVTFRRSAAGTPSMVSLVQPSSLAPAGARLWSDPALSELAALLFTIQDHFAASVYPELSPLMLDLEVDVTSDGRSVIKQVRPYTP